MKFHTSDACFDTILHIIGYLLTMARLFFGQNFGEFVDMFPTTIFKTRKFAGLNTDEFVKFVVCPKCHKLYTYDQAMTVVDGRKETNTCDFVRFPNHIHERMRTPCGASLMKVVVSTNGSKQWLYPYKIYAYQSLKVSLQRLLQRQEILSAISKGTSSCEGGYFDIYDGEAWQQLKDSNGEFYFGKKRNLAGIFNIDWFQPFESSEHSVGALYLVLLNLPREMRFKKENVILVGIIPGPKEPDLNVNTYLQPLVNELMSFWKGIYLYENSDLTLYRFIVLCIASDLPATRKCCGFLSYNALKGMSFFEYGL